MYGTLQYTHILRGYSKNPRMWDTTQFSWWMVLVLGAPSLNHQLRYYYRSHSLEYVLLYQTCHLFLAWQWCFNERHDIQYVFLLGILHVRCQQSIGEVDQCSSLHPLLESLPAHFECQTWKCQCPHYINVRITKKIPSPVNGIYTIQVITTPWPS